MDYSATKKYMDILRAQYDGCSNYRIAQLLCVSKSCVSHWSNGKNGMGDDAAARLADLCGLDPVEVITELYLERSKSRVTRHYFEEVLKRSGGIHAVVFAGILTLIYPAISAFPMM